MASFSACQRCGVRLSAPSMAYHQQMCGRAKESTDANINIGAPTTPSAGGRVLMPSTVASPLMPNPFQQQSRLSREELNALRHEVYAGAPKVAHGSGGGDDVRERREHSSGRHQQSTSALDVSGADGGAEFNAPSQRLVRRRSSKHASVASPTNAGDRSPRVPSSSSASFVNMLAGRLEDVMAAFDEHVDYCRREFVHVENVLSRQQKQQSSSSAGQKAVEELSASVHDVREELRTAADEILMLRRDMKVMSEDNARLRDELRKVKLDRGGPIAADDDFIELKSEVSRLRGLLDSSQREAQQHLRDMRAIRDECMDEATAAKRDSRILSREMECVREELDALRKKLSAASYVDPSSGGAGGQNRPKNVSLTVQHHALPRRSPSGGGQGAVRVLPRGADRSNSGDYLTADDSADEPAIVGFQRHGGGKASQSITDHLDTSVQQMRRDTENIITRAMQHKRPAAVVSARSLSRGHDDDHGGNSVSPEQRNHIPVAHASLRN